jgi:hypothetical protein
MAHFYVPNGSGPQGYDIDNKLAPGSVWRMQIPEKGRRMIAVFGAVNGMKITSNNSAAVDPKAWFEERTGGDILINIHGTAIGTSLVDVMVGGRSWAKLQVQVVPAPADAEHILIIRDVRLDGWKPTGDVIEVDANTPLRYVMDVIRARGERYSGNVRAIFMAHGLPGFVQCAQGSFTHPQVGNGITVADLNQFDLIAGFVKQITFYSCLVARIGSCPEIGGMAGYDGNQLCFMLAQRIRAKVRASIHLQYYQYGNGKWSARYPDNTGITFGSWNGTVFTWGPAGNIIQTQQFPYRDPALTGHEYDD